jgi:hypothetical protein
MALTRLPVANAIPDDSIANVKMANIVQSKNIIINGDMQIAQRGTSTASVTGDGYKTVDRFINEMSSAGTWTLSQDTDVPSGYGFSSSLKYDCTTANGSLSAGSWGFISQRFEGQNLQYLNYGTSSAQKLTLSFWVKSVKTGTYIVEMVSFATTKSQSQSYTISSASTWEKKTITFTGDTATAIANSNARSFNLNFWLVAGTTYTSGTLNTSYNTTTNANRAVGQVNLADSTSNNFWITGIQLEAGDTASEFEFLPVDVNLFRCQRYYFKTQDGVGTANALLMTGGVESSTSAGQGSLTLPTEMRTDPTLSFGSGVRFYSTGSSTVTPTIATNRSTSSNLSAAVTISSGSNGQAGYCYQGAASGNIIGDAEL